MKSSGGTRTVLSYSCEGLASMPALVYLMHVCLTSTCIPGERTFACVIILSHAEHESVGIMIALIIRCSIMKMIRHIAMFSLIVYSAMPMRATDVMCAEMLQF